MPKDDEKAFNKRHSCCTEASHHPMGLGGSPPSAPIVVKPEACVVVMPLDASEHSEYCLEFYLRFIHKPENKVYVCYVAEDFLRMRMAAEPRKSFDISENRTMLPGPGAQKPKRSCCSKLCSCFQTVEVGPSPGVLAELEQTDKANCHKLKVKVKDFFHTNNVNHEFRRLTGPDPGTIIIEFSLSTEVNASLIVMGSKGQGKLKSSIFGSVSHKVLKNSIVPVLIVKHPHAESHTNAGSGGK